MVVDEAEILTSGVTVSSTSMVMELEETGAWLAQRIEGVIITVMESPSASVESLYILLLLPTLIPFLRH